MGAGASVEPETVIAKATENLAANPDNRACKHLLALKAAGKLDEVRGWSLATRHHCSSPHQHTYTTHLPWLLQLSEDLKTNLYLCAKTGLDNVDSGLGCYAMVRYPHHRLMPIETAQPKLYLHCPLTGSV